ncbi:MAG: MBL fold metallo-hydrolase [Deltaproteobacteria bacterium]|nr:MBL fold metallo-hydrolase [Deltaproteobacteria bacterium]MBW2445372.1 MBL fold metallo-hydrolase [Deltaproteobacteria bacterium]
MELRAIARDVYACLQEDRGLGYSNSGLVNRGGGLVVDTFWDLPHTREMLEAYATVWPRPAERVVNTHHNGDHCWGNQLFPQAEIIGHRLCRDLFEAAGTPAGLEVLKGLAAKPGTEPGIAEFGRRLSDWDFNGIELTPPTTILDERMELDLGGRAAHLIYVGPAHTAGDVIVHLPEEGVLFAGDILFHRCTPIGWEGTTDNWCKALDLMVELAPETVVPGHGPICDVEGPKQMKAYLQYVLSECRRFREAGLTPLEAARKIDLGPFADWTEPERLYFNVSRAYRELEGQPWDAQFDTGELFTGMMQLAKEWGRL